jgi:hypothetical protein
VSKDIFNGRDPFNDDDFFEGFTKNFTKLAVGVVLLNIAYALIVLGFIAWLIWLLFL